MSAIRTDYIVKTPGVLSGRARIDGRRVAVWMIVDSYYNLQTSEAGFKEHYNLSPAEVYAALSYYHDHREEIDAEIAEAYEPIPEAESGREFRKTLLKRWGDKHGLDGEQEMTVTEVAADYGISPQTVREACAKGWLNARKSGATWLITRFSAHSRWGKRDSGE